MSIKKEDDELSDVLVFNMLMMDECHPAAEGGREKRRCGKREKKPEETPVLNLTSALILIHLL